MRQPRTHSGSSLFLMELILAILFFSVASAVCVQLFARAHTASEQSAALNRAVLAVRLMGVRAGDTPGVLTAWYDRTWNPCAERDARYRLDILIHGPEGGGSLPGRPGGLWEAEITVGRTADGVSEELYRLSARRYQPAA